MGNKQTMATSRVSTGFLRTAITGKWHTRSLKTLRCSTANCFQIQKPITQNLYTKLVYSKSYDWLALSLQNGRSNFEIRRLASSNSKADVESRVLTVCKAFDKITADKLTLDSHFINDLGLDSLDHVEVIMAIEDEFGFEIPDGHAEKLLTPVKIVEYVSDHENIAA